MRAAIDEAGFLADPFGACLAGRSFVYFCARPHLCGFALWGRPDGDDLRRLQRVLELELGEAFPPHVSLVDASRLEGVDPGAFAVLHAYVEAHRARLAEQVERLAIVRPPGVAGATVAGFFHVAEAPYPIEIVADVPAALRWLGERDDGLSSALEDAIAAATGAPPFLVSLRRQLEAKPGGLPIEDAARVLGLSPRSLQRKLRDAGCTYQGEVAEAQVRAAQALLRDTELSLTAIAFEVGCATPQHFSALFRRIAGETPSAWRTRVRS